MNITLRMETIDEDMNAIGPMLEAFQKVIIEMCFNKELTCVRERGEIHDHYGIWKGNWTVEVRK